MGMFSAKCSQCWDPMPCGCQAGKEREAAISRQIQRQADERREALLREQNALLKRIADAAERQR